MIDQHTAVRQGEELPVEKLAAYLQQQLPELNSALVVKQYPSGYSNLTFFLQCGEREFVLRRPPFGAKIKTAHDMSREYRILSRLRDVYPRVPRPLLYCDDESIIGAPFYVMERVQGIILRDTVPEDLLLAPSQLRDLSGAFVDNLAQIHSLDYHAAGLGDLGKDRK